MTKELLVAELLCTRLCHDLTGPIGAVNNGAEFLSEEGFSKQNEAVDLIVSSAFSAVSRLQFYRFAYGRVKDGGEASLSDKKAMVVDFFKGSKVELDWSDEHTDASGVSVSSKMVRLIFNLLIITSNALLKGGKITVRVNENENGDKVITVSAEGPAVKWEKDVALMVSAPMTDEALTAKNIQMHLTYELLQELHMTLTQESNPQSLLFTATQPRQEGSHFAGITMEQAHG
jgi:histidine phosphotransferase ChpT